MDSCLRFSYISLLHSTGYLLLEYPLRTHSIRCYEISQNLIKSNSTDLYIISHLNTN